MGRRRTGRPAAQDRGRQPGGDPYSGLTGLHCCAVAYYTCAMPGGCRPGAPSREAEGRGRRDTQVFRSTLTATCPCQASLLGVEVIDNTPDCPYTHTLLERQQYHMDFIERFQFEQSHSKASVAARLDSLEVRMILAPLTEAASQEAENAPACAICLTDFQRGEYAMVFKKCGHAFHCKCLNPWLERSSTCPCCRDKLIEAHVHSAISSSTAVAAPTDVANLLREGSGLVPSPAAGAEFRGSFDNWRAEAFLGSADEPQTGPPAQILNTEAESGALALRNGTN